MAISHHFLFYHKCMKYGDSKFLCDRKKSSRWDRILKIRSLVVNYITNITAKFEDFSSLGSWFPTSLMIRETIKMTNSQNTCKIRFGGFVTEDPVMRKLRFDVWNKIILVQNCLKNNSITGPKLYLKREKFYSRFKKVTISSFHPLHISFFN